MGVYVCVYVRGLKKSAENVTDWFDWLKKSGENLVNKTSEKWKKLKKSIMSFFGEKFPIRKEKSALQDFTRQYVIDGKDGYSPKDFLSAVKPKVVEKLKENKQTKTKMILNCEMERTIMSSGEVIQDPAAFHSHIEINLEGSDENEMFYQMMKEFLRILLFSNFKDLIGDL